MAGPLGGDHPSDGWQGRRLDYITYRAVPGSSLSPVSTRAQASQSHRHRAFPHLVLHPQEVEQVTFSTALAGLTDHLALGLRLRISTAA